MANRGENEDHSSELQQEVAMTLVVPNDDNDTWVTRSQAKAWVQNVIRDMLSKVSKQWKGHLKAVIPYSSKIDGQPYKIIFQNVPEELMEAVVIPALRAQGELKVLSAEESERKKMMRTASQNLQMQNRKVLGDQTRQQSFLEEVLALRGTGGTERAKRKFAESLIKGHERCGNIASKRLRECIEAEEEKGGNKD